MLLKLLIPDGRTGLTARVLGGGRMEPAVDRIISGFDEIEYGGEVWGDFPDPRQGDGVATGADVQEAVFQSLCTRIPGDGDGWHTPIVNALARDFDRWKVLPGAQEQYAAHWVKLYAAGDTQPRVVIHDCRAFLCDDAGQTLEKLGPPLV